MVAAQPYLQFTVEEAASVVALAHWTNTRARLVGRLAGFDPGTGRGRLAAAGEGVTAQVTGSDSLPLC
jgi:hypothetical protein